MPFGLNFAPPGFHELINMLLGRNYTKQHLYYVNTFIAASIVPYTLYMYFIVGHFSSARIFQELISLPVLKPFDLALMF